ncbi:glycosyltransferase [Patescibacteria group bacterium]|nr:glycosyltransferase [Patescibacteria group bacterium]MBU0847646.1 glycosyltransferase [Patescibacteria group bacterium]
MSIKISTYISTINALFFQSTLEQTIRQSLLFSDEIIVVNSEYSSDGTQNLLDDLHSEYPNQIKIYSFKEDYNVRHGKLADKKTFALKKCAGDYCILQDDDECIHEKYADYIRQLPEICPDTLAFRFNTIHFYRSYNHYQTGNDWYKNKIYMVKNIPEIKHGRVINDCDNHIIYDKNLKDYVPLDSLIPPHVINTPITSYHYGWARNDCILLIKKYFQEIRWHGKDYWNKNKFPFRFDKPETLEKFSGTHPYHMRSLIEKETKYPKMRLEKFDMI